MPNPSRVKQLVGLGGWFAVSFSAAAVGATASIRASEYYQQLARPSWAPPASVFGPVWSVLYAMMAISAWLVWKDQGFGRARTALSFFLAQLVANALWSWLFFAWHQGRWAFVEVLVLWGLVLMTLVMFWRIRTLAGVLLLPYLTWVTFAAALCYSTWKMNPLSLGE